MKQFILALIIICLPATCLADEHDSTKAFELPDSSLCGFMCLEEITDSLFEIFIDSISVGLIDNRTDITIMITTNEVWQDEFHSTSDVFWVRTDYHGLNFIAGWQLSDLKVRVYFDPTKEKVLKKLCVFADK